MSTSQPTAQTNGGQKTWTVLELLKWTTDHFADKGIDTARLDAECLLAHALGSDRMRLYIDFEKPVLEDERDKFRELVRKRAGERIPVSQLLGTKEFWSLELRVTRDVLTPRPETEALVQAALDRLADPEKPWRVLDVGTGSGAVALAIAVEKPQSVITATDISQEALKIAQENAETHGVSDRIRFLEGDLLRPVKGESFDLVVSNPPYVARSTQPGLPPELAHEPDVALFGGEDGFEVYDRLIGQAREVLSPAGVLWLEHGASQAAGVTERLLAAGFVPLPTRQDLAGIDRVTGGTFGLPARGGTLDGVGE
jgi:release factor glutamine methyltransferase